MKFRMLVKIVHVLAATMPLVIAAISVVSYSQNIPWD